MANKYGEEEYRNLSNISVSHIYNLKKTVSYQRSAPFYQETKKAKGRTIGERCKPEPGGKPGYLRVDTVHQGDRDGEKGVYHINTVDEVVQWEVVGAVEKITDCHLIPLLQKIIANHIGQRHAKGINEFYFECFNEYLNFHRPCAFPIEVKDKKGKIKKKYRYQDYMTPYEKLRSIPNARVYLKESITFERLDKKARRYSDNEMANDNEMAKKVQLEVGKG